jgi:hypothetical protein
MWCSLLSARGGAQVAVASVASEKVQRGMVRWLSAALARQPPSLRVQVLLISTRSVPCLGQPVWTGEVLDPAPVLGTKLRAPRPRAQIKVLSLVIELNEHGGAPFKQECRALVLKYGHTVHASMFVLISTDASRSGIRDAGKRSH